METAIETKQITIEIPGQSLQTYKMHPAMFPVQISKVYVINEKLQMKQHGLKRTICALLVVLDDPAGQILFERKERP
jgi:hypothetical protein